MERARTGYGWKPPQARHANLVADAAEASVRTKPPNYAQQVFQPSNNVLSLRNDSGGDLLAGACLEIGDPLLTDTDPDNVWHEGLTPTPDENLSIAIALDAVPDGEIGDRLFLVSGFCYAPINVTSEAHTFADPSSGTTVLQSGTSGRAKIVWKESGTGTKNALLLIPVSASEGSTPPPGNERLGYATLSADLCAEATGTASGGAFWDGTSISPSAGTVDNRFGHRGKSGDLVMLGLVDWGAGDVWTVFDVKKQQKNILNDLGLAGCAIQVDQVTAAIEACAEPTADVTKIQMYELDIVTDFEVPTRASEDTIRDQAQDACSIVGKTKTICQFAETPDAGDDVTVASLAAKTFIKEIFTDTMCVDNVVVPVISASIQTVYVVCHDLPIEEVQIEGEPCEGEEESC